MTLDLTGLWRRETELVGAYTYGTDERPDGTTVETFDLATETADAIETERWLSATSTSPTTSTPSPMPPTPGNTARSRSHLTFGERRNASSRIRARRRPLEPHRRCSGRRGALIGETAG